MVIVCLVDLPPHARPFAVAVRHSAPTAVTGGNWESSKSGIVFLMGYLTASTKSRHLSESAERKGELLVLCKWFLGFRMNFRMYIMYMESQLCIGVCGFQVHSQELLIVFIISHLSHRWFLMPIIFILIVFFVDHIIDHHYH